jgi:hypothetical protein
MTILTDAQLLERIQAFCADNDMKPTRFGREALGEASLIASLEGGRSPSLKIANKIIAFMDGYGSDHSGTDTAEDELAETGNRDEISTADRQAA